MPYYEDFEVGQTFISDRRTVTDGMATVLIDVGGFTLPQFNDEISANKTPLGWRALPGRVVFLLMGGLVERLGIFHNPGHGLLVSADNLKWKGIVRVGDTIHLVWKVTEMRKTSNPKWGVVKNSETLINQKGDVVLEVEITHLFGYKPV